MGSQKLRAEQASLEFFLNTKSEGRNLRRPIYDLNLEVGIHGGVMAIST
jgi:hypothetical protein